MQRRGLAPVYSASCQRVRRLFSPFSGFAEVAPRPLRINVSTSCIRSRASARPVIAGMHAGDDTSLTLDRLVMPSTVSRRCVSALRLLRCFPEQLAPVSGPVRRSCSSRARLTLRLRAELGHDEVLHDTPLPLEGITRLARLPCGYGKVINVFAHRRSRLYRPSSSCSTSLRQYRLSRQIRATGIRRGVFRRRVRWTHLRADPELHLSPRRSAPRTHRAGRTCPTTRHI